MKTKTVTKPVVFRGVREPECSVELVELEREKSIWTKHNRLSSKHAGLLSIGHRKYRSIQHVNTYRETTEPFMSIPLAQFHI